MSQVKYSQPGWSSPFPGPGNSVGPPVLSGVIMFSVKHNQSPRSLPLYKPPGPPINSGWLGDLSSQADRWAEPSRAGPSEVADSGLNPDADVRWPAPRGSDRFVVSQHALGGACGRPRQLSSDHRQCVNVAKVKRKKFMVVFGGPGREGGWVSLVWRQTAGHPWESSATPKECKAIK